MMFSAKLDDIPWYTYIGDGHPVTPLEKNAFLYPLVYERQCW